MSLWRIRWEAQRGLPLTRSEAEAFALEGLLPLRPLGSRTESILTALLLSLAPVGDLETAYVIRHAENYLGALLTGRGRRNRRSRAARIITSLYPDLNPALLVIRPWSILQYPIALIMAWAEMAEVSTSLIQKPSDGSSMEFGFHRFGCQIGRPIILLSSGHFAGVVACTQSRTPTHGDYLRRPKATPVPPKDRSPLGHPA